MTSSAGTARPARHPARSRALGALARIYWMFLGNMLLMLLACALLLEPGSGWVDAAFFGAAASIVLVRVLDVSVLGGTTADGEPSSRADVRRFVVLYLFLAVVVWGAAKVMVRLVPS